MIKIAVVLEKCDEGGYTVHVPTVPGCYGEGATLQEALANIAEAIELHLEAIPDDLAAEECGLVKELCWERIPPLAAPDPGLGADERSPSTSPATAAENSPSTISMRASTPGELGRERELRQEMQHKYGVSPRRVRLD